MRLEWIVQPVMTYALVAIGLALCLFLFVSLKRDVSACDARNKKKLDALDAGWRAKLQSLDERFEELSHVSSLLVPPAAPRSGLNLNKRSQALQMHRRGDAPPEIAAALSLPQNEVELLVKVQQIVLLGLEKPASRAAGR